MRGAVRVVVATACCAFSPVFRSESPSVDTVILSAIRVAVATRENSPLTVVGEIGLLSPFGGALAVSMMVAGVME